MAPILRDLYPEVSILFNWAGIMRAFELMDDNLDLERTTAEVETNLTGTIWMTEALLPQLAQQNEAMIVTVSSGLSYVTSPCLFGYQGRRAYVYRRASNPTQEIEIEYTRDGACPTSRCGN